MFLPSGKDALFYLTPLGESSLWGVSPFLHAGDKLMNTINWDSVPKSDRDLLNKCVKRAKKVFPDIDSGGLLMDIWAVNSLIPLNLERLLHANAGDFAHDIIGIHNHFDRDTKTQGKSFCPRHAKFTVSNLTQHFDEKILHQLDRTVSNMAINFFICRDESDSNDQAVTDYEKFMDADPEDDWQEEFLVWQPFEHESLSEIQTRVDELRDSFMQFATQVLIDCEVI
jgi:hypothetical protein